MTITGKYQIATVAYQVGTYQGTINIPCYPDDDNETIIAIAKSRTHKVIGMSMFYESYKIIKRV